MSEKKYLSKISVLLQFYQGEWNRVLYFWILISFFTVAITCCISTNSESESLPVESHNEDKSFSEEVDIEYAKNFSVTYQNNYKVATISYASDSRSIDIKQKIVLVQKGTQIPELVGELKDAWVVKVPLETVAGNDDGEVTRLTSLGLTENIVAMGGGAIYDPEMRKRWEDKKLTDIGYSFVHIPSPEVMVDLNPDLALLYTFDNERQAGIFKLRQFGVNAVPTFAWAEESFLGKAEWIKFTSLFFNKEDQANLFFTDIELKCTALIDKVKAIGANKKALWIYHPSEESDWSAHRNDFNASYLEGIGIVNVLNDNGPNHPVGITNEELIKYGTDADFWIINSTTDSEWPPASYLNLFKAYRNDQVYHYQFRTRYEHNAYDWYETAEVRPDLVLQDLISIFYPELLLGHELFFFEKVNLTKLKNGK